MTDQETSATTSYESLAIVELMGHVRMTGRVTEVERFGSKVGRIDVINRDGEIVATQYFGGAGLYRMTECDEQTAKDLAVRPDMSSAVAWSLRSQIRSEIEKSIQDQRPQIEGVGADDDDDLPV